MSQDSHLGVRWHVALDPSTSPDILRILAQDEDVRVRWAVAENPDILILRISLFYLRDGNHDVRGGVAENPNTPYGIWIAEWGRMLP